MTGNPDFEAADVHRNWTCLSCRLTLSDDGYSGSHSGLVDHRTHSYSALRQFVTLRPGGVYSLSLFIKVKAAPSTLNGQVQVGINAACTHDDGKIVYMTFGLDPYITVGVWTEISGQHSIPAAVHGCYIYVKISEPHVSYLVDHANLKSIDEGRNWRQDARHRIEQHRKSNIHVHLTGSLQGSYKVQVTQTSHQFAFGTAVNSWAFMEHNNKAYRDTIYELFNWAVLESVMKWKYTDPHQGAAHYDMALNVIKELRKHGLKVRGHNIFWSKEQYVPDWVKTLSKNDVLRVMERRLHGIVGAMKGLVEHWDVNNENLHGHWFETATGNDNVTMKMFRDVHHVDPDVKLFLNDYGVVQNWAATALGHQAELFQDSGVPLHGVGVQSHIQHVPVDISSVKNAIETVGKTGLPVWITEMTVKSADKQLRADGIEDAMTLYFSLPEVEGILLWGFWDRHIYEPQAALFEGPSVQPNAAGTVLRRLLTSTWRTDVTHHVTSSSESFTTKGFKGTYNVTVMHGNSRVKSETFQLGDSDKTINIHLDGPTPSIVVG